MTKLHYKKVPINESAGFPQSFRLSMNDVIYRINLYINIPEKILGSSDEVFDLLETGSRFMVMQVVREGSGDLKTLFHRKLVKNIELYAAELSFKFREIQIARGNLNGIGDFGSKVVAGVALRWL